MLSLATTQGRGKEEFGALMMTWDDGHAFLVYLTIVHETWMTNEATIDVCTGSSECSTSLFCCFLFIV